MIYSLCFYSCITSYRSNLRICSSLSCFSSRLSGSSICNSRICFRLSSFNCRIKCFKSFHCFRGRSNIFKIKSYIFTRSFCNCEKAIYKSCISYIPTSIINFPISSIFNFKKFASCIKPNCSQFCSSRSNSWPKKFQICHIF